MKGDYFLLAGIYDHALTHYGKTIERLKSESDYLWIGGALEGMAIAKLVFSVFYIK